MVKAVTLITTELGKMDEICSKIREVKGVKDAFVIAGRADIVVYFEGDVEEISKIMREIGRIEGVKTTETLIEVK